MTQTNNFATVASFVETYGNTSKFLNLPSEFPASIRTLCDYILDNDKETTNWKVVADMFSCFATEINNPLDKVFSDAKILVVMAYVKSVTKSNVVEDNIGLAYNEIISRVKALKKACEEMLMETAEVNAANKELEEKVADLNCYCDGSIEEIFDASDVNDGAKVYGIVFIDKKEVVKTHYDIASHSVVIEDMEGEELYTTLEDFTEDFIKFCTEKFGEEYTQYWAA